MIQWLKNLFKKPPEPVVEQVLEPVIEPKIEPVTQPVEEPVVVPDIEIQKLKEGEQLKQSLPNGRIAKIDAQGNFIEWHKG